MKLQTNTSKDLSRIEQWVCDLIDIVVPMETKPNELTDEQRHIIVFSEHTAIYYAMRLLPLDKSVDLIHHQTAHDTAYIMTIVDIITDLQNADQQYTLNLLHEKLHKFST